MKVTLAAAIALLISTPAMWAGSPATSVETPPGKSFTPLESYVQPPEKSPWSFTLEPYVWAIGMSGDIGVKGLPTTHVDFKPKTVLQDLNWGVFVRGEIRYQRWGILGDGFFAQLSSSSSMPGPLYDDATVRFQQGMASLALSYRLIEDRRGFLDVYAGVRYNYFGISAGASTDSEGIQELSEQATRQISTGISQRVDSFLTQNTDEIAAAMENEVKGVLARKGLKKLSGGTIDGRDLSGLARAISRNSGAFRELVAAKAQERLAAAKGAVSENIRNRVARAEKKFATALAKKIDDTLPTSWEGDQWWLDPIIGLRGQLNITRWLFLAAQGDVGGFGAGSDIAWNVQASIGVNFTRNVFAELGYRYFYMDYSNDGCIYQAAEAGIFSGIGVKF